MLKNNQLKDRTDISDFIIHFTRDNNGISALDNLINILNEMKIKAYGHHCLFNKSLNKQSDDIRQKFNVACFTETPLQNLKSTFSMQNKQKHFKPYGIVFEKDLLNDYYSVDIINKLNHPNPVFYLSCDNKKLTQYFYEQYKQWLEDFNNHKTNDFHLFGALVNLVNEEHNFIWEREWRTVGDYKFITPDIVVVIVPEKEHEVIREKVNNFSESITLIDIDWSFETLLRKISSFAWNNRYKYEQALSELEQLKSKVPKIEIDEEEF